MALPILLLTKLGLNWAAQTAWGHMGHPNPEIWKWNQGWLQPQVLGDINSGLREPFEGIYVLLRGFPGGTSGKEPTCQCRRRKRHGFDPWVGKISWRRAWQPTPVLLPGESPWTEEPGGLPSMGSRRVGPDMPPCVTEPSLGPLTSVQ